MIELILSRPDALLLLHALSLSGRDFPADYPCVLSKHVAFRAPVRVLPHLLFIPRSNKSLLTAVHTFTLSILPA